MVCQLIGKNFNLKGAFVVLHDPRIKFHLCLTHSQYPIRNFHILALMKVNLSIFYVVLMYRIYLCIPQRQRGSTNNFLRTEAEQLCLFLIELCTPGSFCIIREHFSLRWKQASLVCHTLPTRTLYKQVCVQLPTSADNVALPAFAAARHTAVRLLLTAGRAAIDRYLLHAWLSAANPQQRRAAAEW